MLLNSNRQYSRQVTVRRVPPCRGESAVTRASVLYRGYRSPVGPLSADESRAVLTQPPIASGWDSAAGAGPVAGRGGALV